MEITVQWIRTTWTKESRGGEAATRRNAALVGFALPVGQPAFAHVIRMHEDDGFEPYDSREDLGTVDVQLEKRPGFFDVNVPAERLGIEDRREEDWRNPFPLPFLGNTIADEAHSPGGVQSAARGLASALPGLLDGAGCRRREHLRG